MNISDDVVNEYNSYDKMLHVSCKNVYDTELYLKFNHLTIEVVYDKDFLQSIERITLPSPANPSCITRCGLLPGS